VSVADANLLEGLSLVEFSQQILEAVGALVLTVEDELLLQFDHLLFDHVLAGVREGMVVELVLDELPRDVKVLIASVHACGVLDQLVGVLADDLSILFAECAGRHRWISMKI